MKKRTAAQKIHFIGALVYVGACLLLGIYRIVDTGSVFNLFKCWVSVLYLLIPPILCWLFRKKPSYSMNLCIYWLYVCRLYLWGLLWNGTITFPCMTWWLISSAASSLL